MISSPLPKKKSKLQATRNTCFPPLVLGSPSIRMLHHFIVLKCNSCARLFRSSTAPSNMTERHWAIVLQRTQSWGLIVLKCHTGMLFSGWYLDDKYKTRNQGREILQQYRLRFYFHELQHSSTKLRQRVITVQ